MKSLIIGGISFITFVLFLYTGIYKFINISVFREQLLMSSILKPFAEILVWLIPLLEFATAILLAIPKFRLYGFYAALVLMIFFTMYIIAILIADKNHPCGCGGIIEFLSLKQHLIMNCTFVALDYIGLRFQKRHINNQNDIFSLNPF